MDLLDSNTISLDTIGKVNKNVNEGRREHGAITNRFNWNRRATDEDRVTVIQVGSWSDANQVARLKAIASELANEQFEVIMIVIDAAALENVAALASLIKSYVRSIPLMLTGRQEAHIAITYIKKESAQLFDIEDPRALLEEDVFSGAVPYARTQYADEVFSVARQNSITASQEYYQRMMVQFRTMLHPDPETKSLQFIRRDDFEYLGWTVNGERDGVGFGASLPSGKSASWHWKSGKLDRKYNLVLIETGDHDLASDYIRLVRAYAQHCDDLSAVTEEGVGATLPVIKSGWNEFTIGDDGFINVLILSARSPARMIETYEQVSDVDHINAIVLLADADIADDKETLLVREAIARAHDMLLVEMVAPNMAFVTVSKTARTPDQTNNGLALITDKFGTVAVDNLVSAPGDRASSIGMIEALLMTRRRLYKAIITHDAASTYFDQLRMEITNGKPFRIVLIETADGLTGEFSALVTQYARHISNSETVFPVICGQVAANVPQWQSHTTEGGGQIEVLAVGRNQLEHLEANLREGYGDAEISYINAVVVIVPDQVNDALAQANVEHALSHIKSHLRSLPLSKLHFIATGSLPSADASALVRGAFGPDAKFTPFDSKDANTARSPKLLNYFNDVIIEPLKRDPAIFVKFSVFRMALLSSAPTIALSLVDYLPLCSLYDHGTNDPNTSPDSVHDNLESLIKGRKDAMKIRLGERTDDLDVSLILEVIFSWMTRITTQVGARYDRVVLFRGGYIHVATLPLYLYKDGSEFVNVLKAGKQIADWVVYVGPSKQSGRVRKAVDNLGERVMGVTVQNDEMAPLNKGSIANRVIDIWQTELAIKNRER